MSHQRPSMRCHDLIEGLDLKLLSGPVDVEIGGVQHDSRRVKPGDLFVAIKGRKADGHDFIQEALAKGAAGLIVQRRDIPLPSTLPVLLAEDTRKVLALVSARFHGEPSKQLILVGVTGTNGKTTTTYLIEAILKEAGWKVGLLGTISYRFAGTVVPAERTTPESSDLQAFLARILREGARAAILEVSSHSLALHRVLACDFDVAVFTNLTQDHLDFHGTLEAYREAKAKLFEGLPDRATKGVEKAAFLNADDPTSALLAERTRARVFTYGLEQGADLTARDLELSLDGIKATVSTPWGTFQVHSPLVGRYNLSNVLGALGVGLHLGIPPEVASRGIALLKSVPGRFEKVEMGQPFGVVVDYAHTPDALERVLHTARGFCTGRLISVFGCGGDRDRGKRPKMGEVSTRLADLTVFTSDNPRSEDPVKIIAEIEEGAKKVCPSGGRYVTIPDRRQAIEYALAQATAGDLVVIAGKGHETSQIIGDTILPFDDREVACQILKELGYGR